MTKISDKESARTWGIATIVMAIIFTALYVVLFLWISTKENKDFFDLILNSASSFIFPAIMLFFGIYLLKSYD